MFSNCRKQKSFSFLLPFSPPVAQMVNNIQKFVILLFFSFPLHLPTFFPFCITIHQAPHFLSPLPTLMVALNLGGGRKILGFTYPAPAFFLLSAIVFVGFVTLPVSVWLCSHRLPLAFSFFFLLERVYHVIELTLPLFAPRPHQPLPSTPHNLLIYTYTSLFL